MQIKVKYEEGHVYYCGYFEGVLVVGDRTKAVNVAPQNVEKAKQDLIDKGWEIAGVVK
jgi:hypothetical protein